MELGSLKLILFKLSNVKKTLDSTVYSKKAMPSVFLFLCSDKSKIEITRKVKFFHKER